MLLFFALIGCASSTDSEPRIESDPGWELGEPVVCGASGLGWSEAPLAVESHLPPEGYEKLGWDGGGAVALAEIGGRRLLYWTRHDGGDGKGGSVGARDLASGLLPDPPLVDVTAFALGDVDGDGLLDLVAAADPVQVLYAAGTPDEARVVYPRAGVGEARDVTLGDVDGDGLLDLYLALTTDPFSDAPVTVPGELWRGVGGRAFEPAPIDAPEAWWGRPFDARALDREGDGDLDVYLCNDAGTGGGPNNWLENPGDGRLVATEDAAAMRGACMGQDWGDIDGDGGLDLLVADAIRAAVLLDGTTDASQPLRAPYFESPKQMAWGGRVADLDADGAADLALATGDFWYDGAGGWPLVVTLQGESGFLPPLEGLPRLTSGRGLVVADTDGDGGLDLLLGDAERSPWWLRSAGCPPGAWLDVEAPHGTTVRVEAGDRVAVGVISTDASYASAGPPVARIGLGAADTVDAVILAVPGLGEVRLEGPIAARRRVRWAP